MLAACLLAFIGAAAVKMVTALRKVSSCAIVKPARDVLQENCRATQSHFMQLYTSLALNVSPLHATDMIQVIPKVIWEERVALIQLCNKVPISYNGTPQVYPQNCPSPSKITTPI